MELEIHPENMKQWAARTYEVKGKTDAKSIRIGQHTAKINLEHAHTIRNLSFFSKQIKGKTRP